MTLWSSVQQMLNASRLKLLKGHFVLSQKQASVKADNDRGWLNIGDVIMFCKLTASLQFKFMTLVSHYNNKSFNYNNSHYSKYCRCLDCRCQADTHAQRQIYNLNNQ